MVAESKNSEAMEVEKTEKDADTPNNNPENDGKGAAPDLGSPAANASATATDTDNNGSNKKPKKDAQSPAANNNTSTTTTTQDVHPYARGSVIEVWHKSGNEGADDWWSEPSDDEDDNVNNTDGEKTVRLCDIIDRAQNNNNETWRYYVHYKDFNRRMDEWIHYDRIVSPPSIGNAKARALKKEEEREKRKKQKLEEEKLLLEAPRGRRRATTTDADADHAEGVSRRARRPTRKKGDDEDDGTVVASNSNNNSNPNDSSGNNNSNSTNSNSPDDAAAAAKKMRTTEILAMPTDAVTTQTVGEHVVATVKAQELDEHEGLDEESLREHEEVTKVKNVGFMELGQFQMETWYFSPIPKELLSSNGFIDVLYVCEFTFGLFSRKTELQRFQSRIPNDRRHPPGNEIYRKGNVAMFEVDGLEQKVYCQNLCYIAKLFLDHKTLYYDVDPFLFYVLCEVDDRGFHPVGYYSKEKYSDVGYNLACILTFPAHQRKGYGRFLIAFSYELSKKEMKVGSPEKPMSDLGQQAYKPYWASTIVDFLLNQSHEQSLSIMDISKRTSIMAEDIVYTLNQLGLLKIINGVYFVAAERKLLEGLEKKYPVKEPRVDPACLHWTPFLTDIKRDKFSIHSKKPSVEAEEARGPGGF